MAKIAKFGTENKAPGLPRPSVGGPVGECGGSAGRVDIAWGVWGPSMGSPAAECRGSGDRVRGVLKPRLWLTGGLFLEGSRAVWGCQAVTAPNCGRRTSEGGQTAGSWGWPAFCYGHLVTQSFHKEDLRNVSVKESSSYARDHEESKSRNCSWRVGGSMEETAPVRSTDFMD